MGSCTTVNCSNSNPKRRKTWIQNCHRDKWQPTNSFELCEVSIRLNLRSLNNIVFI
jgi:hypothetical protein